MDGFTTRPELAGSLGMVATTHWLASQTGMAVLEQGGNAADAAVAAAFVLQVVEPHLNGPGGEVPILVAEPSGRASVVCGQGVAPRAATPAAFAELGLDAVPGTGLLAATVPGAFGAWTVLLQTWGTWTLRQVLEPALALARDGAPVLPRVSDTLSRMAQHFRDSWPTSASTYLAGDGSAPQPWSRLRLPQLAATYERVLAEAEAASAGREAQLEAARAAWYRGFVADAIDRFCRETAWADTSGRRHGGLLTGDDLAAWEPPVEEPLRIPYRDAEVLKAGFWSQGPTLLQQLRLLAELLPDADPLELDDPAWVHAVVEAQKLAFADREAWYGDPDGVDVPAAELLSLEYARDRSLLVDPARADLDLRPAPRAAARRACLRLPSTTSTDAAAAPRKAAWTTPPSRPVSASRRSAGTGSPAATPATSTSSTPRACRCRPPRAEPGCSRRPSSPTWVSRSGPGPRCSGSSRTCRPRCTPVPGPARPCRRR